MVDLTKECYYCGNAEHEIVRIILGTTPSIGGRICTKCGHIGLFIGVLGGATEHGLDFNDIPAKIRNMFHP